MAKNKRDIEKMREELDALNKEYKEFKTKAEKDLLENGA